MWKAIEIMPRGSVEENTTIQFGVKKKKKKMAEQEKAMRNILNSE